MAVVQITSVVPVPCVWRFDGFDAAALDERTDELPPRLQGVLLVPVSVVTGSLIEESERDQKSRHAREIELFYRSQGMTARDLQRMTAQDAAASVPIGVIRDRPAAEIPAGSRGTVSRLSGPLRVVDNTVVPSETPPAP